VGPAGTVDEACDIKTSQNTDSAVAEQTNAD
jgi:hypothetical protein